MHIRQWQTANILIFIFRGLACELDVDFIPDVDHRPAFVYDVQCHTHGRLLSSSVPHVHLYHWYNVKETPTSSDPQGSNISRGSINMH